MPSVKEYIPYLSCSIPQETKEKIALDYSTLKNKAIYSNPGTTKTEVVELPVKEPGPGEVLVRL